MSDPGAHRPTRAAGPAWLSWLRSLARGRGEHTLRASLEEIIEHSEPDGIADEGERAMIRNLLEFGDLDADDVMVPRADIVAVQRNLSLDRLIETFTECDHSRLVVYGESLDDIVGMVHIKDVMRYWSRRDEFRLDVVIRPVLFVPPSLALGEVLLRMQARRCHLAIVIDEYGGADGLITIEDIVEEIVGDIEDEHDQEEEPPITVLADGVIEADARAPIESVEAVLGTRLVLDELEEEIDTLGGLVVALAGRVPAPGERVEHPGGLEFEVVAADPRTVQRLRIRRHPAVAATA